MSPTLTDKTPGKTAGLRLCLGSVWLGSVGLVLSLVCRPVAQYQPPADISTVDGIMQLCTVKRQLSGLRMFRIVSPMFCDSHSNFVRAGSTTDFTPIGQATICNRMGIYWVARKKRCELCVTITARILYGATFPLADL